MCPAKRMKFLTVFYYKDIGPQHLYKDVGSIPFELAKQCGWDSTFAYLNYNGEIHDPLYESFVRLIPVQMKGHPYLDICRFIWKECKYYDVLNFYHLNRRHLLFIFLARLRNRHIRVYVKLDMERKVYQSIYKKSTSYLYKIGGKILQKIRLLPDLCTVETKGYLDSLEQMSIFKGRIKYLPNGCWEDEENSRDLTLPKEKIVLTVGRLGTYQKNTEMLLDSFVAISPEIRKDWKLILIGTYTEEIFQKGRDLENSDKSLLGKIIFTGNIRDKNRLNRYYSRAAIFCLPSRYESFGIVLVEAMYHGCFPIVTDCCDAFSDILDKGKHGIIIPNYDRESLSSSLRLAMENREEIISNGMQGKSYVQRYFIWKNIIHHLNKYLNDERD